jgi:hypothetical protein
MVKQITNGYKHNQTIKKLSKLGFEHECWVYLDYVKKYKCDVIQHNFVNEFETIVFNVNNQTSEIINITYDNSFVKIVDTDLKSIIKETKHYNSHP